MSRQYLNQLTVSIIFIVLIAALFYKFTETGEVDDDIFILSHVTYLAFLIIDSINSTD